MKNLYSFIFCMVVIISTNYGQACVNGTLEIKLDNYPSETTWNIKNSSGTIVYSGGPYSGEAGQLKVISVCLIPGSNYTFTINDSYGDGICCSYGQGYYKIFYGVETYVQGGQFTSSETKSFCFICVPNNGGGNVAPQRNIVFIHGLGGNEYSWDRMRDVHSKFFVSNYTCPSNIWSPRKSDSRSITYSQQSLSGAGTDALTKTTQMLNEMRGNTQVNPTTDFIIAHSQGGVVARQMDYILQNDPSSRPFGGIITFGSPHGGAKVVNSIESGSVDNFLTKACTDGLAGPIREDAPDNIIMHLFGIPGKVVNVANSICTFAGGLLLPALGGELNQPIRSSLREGSTELIVLNNYSHNSIQKIAAYGVEDDPTLWRLAHSFRDNLNTYSCFGADYDQEMVNTAQNKINEAITKINENDCSWFWCVNQQQRRAAWIKTRDWWLNANREFKLLTGAGQYHADFANTCLIQNYDYGNLVSEYIVPVNTTSECYAYEHSGGTSETTATPYTYQLFEFPSDGIVTETSAKAFPGAYPMEMTGSNHQQMRNDSRTKTVLERAYAGNEKPYFKVELK